MPPSEIREMLSATDVELVHRYVELHRERMDERLAELVGTLLDVERDVSGAVRVRADSRAHR
jgi:hypothetical protein